MICSQHIILASAALFAPAAAQFLQPLAIAYPWIEDLNRQLYHPKGVIFHNGINFYNSIKVQTIEQAPANSINSDQVGFLNKVRTLRGRELTQNLGRDEDRYKPSV